MGGPYRDSIRPEGPSTVTLAVNGRMHVGGEGGGDEVGREPDELRVARQRRRSRKLEVGSA